MLKTVCTALTLWLVAVVRQGFAECHSQRRIVAASYRGPLILPAEEHAGDRFRTCVNQRVFGGVEALTPESILWINLAGVWGVTLASLYAAVIFGAGWGLAGIYLELVNAVTHVIGAVGSHGYNPGLWTSLAFFLPVGGFAWWSVVSSAGVSGVQHAVGLGIALAIHAAIAIFARGRARRLRTLAAVSQ